MEAETWFVAWIKFCSRALVSSTPEAKGCVTSGEKASWLSNFWILEIKASGRVGRFIKMGEGRRVRVYVSLINYTIY